MTTLWTIINKHKFYLFLVVLCCFIYSSLVLNRAFVEVVVDSPKKSPFEIFWSKDDGGYSVHRHATVYMKPGVKKYRFYLSNLHYIGKLRIDTHNFEGVVTVKKLTLSQPGYGEVVFHSENDWKQLTPLNHIAGVSFSDKGMTVESNGNDPMFEVKIPVRPSTNPYTLYFGSFVVIAGLIFLLIRALGQLNKELQFVPVIMIGILLLICVVAFTTADGYHPDETAHATAAAYYKDHWKPPLVEDPAIRHTFSPYGTSRLNSGEIYYFFAGKFAKALEHIHLSGYLPYRLFNVFLFSLIVLRCFLFPQTRLLAVPFLLSPQIWYVFSYSTSDAFSLFIAFSAGCQVLLKDSLFNKYLYHRFSYKKIFNVVIAAICFTLVLYLKKTYYPYAAALGIVVLFSWYSNRHDLEWRVVLKKMAAMCIVVLCFAAIPKAVDVSVNGFDKSKRKFELQKEIAEPRFNLASPLEVRSPLFTIKERGQSLDTLLFGHRWFEKTFRTSFGVYGHTTIMGPEGYYDAVRWVAVVFFFYFLSTLILKAQWIYKAEAGMLLGLGCLLIVASIHHSWTLEIQAQGRYLFPIFSIFGLLYARNYRLYNAKAFTTLVSVMFILSAYSFITQAIGRIPR